MDNEHDHKTKAMMDDGEDSGIASNYSGSRRDSLSSMASINSSATSSDDSAIGSMSDRRSSTSSNVSSMSGLSGLSFSSRNSGHSSAGYSNSVSSSRRSSLSSVQSDDSTTTIRSDVTATSRKSERSRTSVADHQQGLPRPPSSSMDNEQDHQTEAMMDDGEDSGIASNDSDSRRDSVSSMASMSSSATSSNDSAVGSMSDRRSSTSSNVSSMSGMSGLSLSSRNSGHISAGYPNSVSSSRRSSLSSVQSDDSTTTFHSDGTATLRKSERNRTSTTSVADHQQGSGHATGTYSKSGNTKVGTHIPTTNTQPTAEQIEIQVVDFAGKPHMVRVGPTDKVKDLKVKVQEKLKIAPSQQRLQFKNKILDDKSTSDLKFHGLHDMCTVYLQGRLQGGALFSTA